MTTDTLAYDAKVPEGYVAEYSDERRYEYGGGVYRMRDRFLVRDTDHGHIKGFTNCEYATKDKSGNTVWKRCEQGVAFDNIERFEAVAD